MANHVIGLDLGQVVDHSAAVVVERRQQVLEVPFPTRETVTDFYRIERIIRWDLHTPWHLIVDRLSELMAKGPLSEALLVIDATGIGGVGGPIYARFLNAWRAGRLGDFSPRPIVISGQVEPKRRSVPKQALFTNLQALIQERRLRLDANLPLAPELMQELRTYEAKTRASGSTSFEAAKQKDHDDIVSALMLAVWLRHTGTDPALFGTTTPPEFGPPKETMI
jgi:hypothetical protein